MNKTLLPIRLVFVLLCAAAGWLLCSTIPDWDYRWMTAISVDLLIGILVVLVDILLKGFSLRGLSAITFGLIVGSAVSHLISRSPLLEEGDPQVIYLVRLSLFIVLTYLCTVIALRGKDEFNLVIPYVCFVPHEVDVPLVVVDTSALIDGRIARICESGFLSTALVIPVSCWRICSGSPTPRIRCVRRGGAAASRWWVNGVESRILTSESGKAT